MGLEQFQAEGTIINVSSILFSTAGETLIPDLMAPKAHQSDHSYVRELSGLSIHYARI